MPKNHKLFHIEPSAPVDHIIWIVQEFKKDLIWRRFWTLKVGKKKTPFSPALPPELHGALGIRIREPLLGQNKNVYFFKEEANLLKTPVFREGLQYIFRSPEHPQFPDWFAGFLPSSCCSCRLRCVKLLLPWWCRNGTNGRLWSWSWSMFSKVYMGDGLMIDVTQVMCVSDSVSF